MTTEILTVDEFALRMHLSRATVFTWMQKGVLEQGTHYLKQGRVLRFLWNEETIKGIALASVTAPKPFLRPIKATKPESINWDY